jgi:hypothetical protein
LITLVNNLKPLGIIITEMSLCTLVSPVRSSRRISTLV